MTDKMREEFEKWALTECFDLTAVGGFYSDNETDAAYKAWQAARTVPDGWIKCSERLPAPYQHVVGLWSYANGVTEMEVTMYECDGAWFDSKEPEYWFPFPAAPEWKK